MPIRKNEVHMGTTYYRILFIAVCTVVLNFQFAFAEPRMPTPTATAAPKPGASKGDASSPKSWGNDPSAQLETPNGKKCTPLEQLDFAGTKFTGKYKCVDAKTDQEAQFKCPGQLFVNPGNPNYGLKIPGGSLTENPAGFYYCVQKFPKENGVTSNDKATMCSNSPLRPEPYYAKWYPHKDAGKAGTGVMKGDGNCMCLSEGNLIDCARTENVVMGPPAPPPAEVQAEAVKPPTAAAATASATTAVSANDPDPKFKECVDKWIEKANKCKAAAETAVHSCDEADKKNNDTNSMIGATAGVTGMLGNIAVAGNQANGSMQECFKSGVMANTAASTINGMRENCSRDYTGCKADCDGSTKVSDIEKDCPAKIGKTIADIRGDTGPNGTYYRGNLDTIKEGFSEGTSTCSVKAKEKQNILGSLFDGVGKALTASLTCVCQLTNAGGDCTKIPSVEDCAAIPAPAGCNGYAAIDMCTPGSVAYDAKGCSCGQNPSAPGCSGSSMNTVASFAGPPINSPGSNFAGGVTMGAGGGGGGGRAPDLGNLNPGDPGSEGFDLGAQRAQGAATVTGGSGGGGGGGGGGNGDANSGAGAPAPEEEKGIGGIFSQAKSFMSNALGLGKGKPSTASGNGAANKFDANKYRPLRGLAGVKGGLGSRNMDIWKMMNSCTSGDTCKSNENNYIVGP